MRVTLLAATQVNPDLLTQDLAASDVRYLVAQGTQAFGPALIEYAGRVCYRSTDKMGTAPGFISARVREGHEDIIEHLQMVFEAWEAPDAEILRAYQVAHGLRFTRRPQSVILSMNARTLRDIIKHSDSELARQLLILAAQTWPMLYADLAREKA
ncbi:MAG: hypothetical protein WAV74_05345 [Anaerolineae bacterium]